MNIQINHGIRILNESTSFEIPKKFEELLDLKITEWKEKGFVIPFSGPFFEESRYFYRDNHAIFTIGHEPTTDTFAIGIKHPRDSFNSTIGKDVVTGRIEKHLGYRRNLYRDEPKFIYSPKKCKNCKFWKPIKSPERGFCSNEKSKTNHGITFDFHLCEEHQE